jgi:hypothetical protein
MMFGALIRSRLRLVRTPRLPSDSDDPIDIGARFDFIAANCRITSDENFRCPETFPIKPRRTNQRLLIRFARRCFASICHRVARFVNQFEPRRALGGQRNKRRGPVISLITQLTSTMI